MRSFLLRLASLTCGLLLTLPPGWCCMWLPGPARAAAPEQSPAEPCCPCCCHPAQPTEPASPAPAPAPRCPCADRDATTPEAVKPPALQPGADLGAPAPAAAGPAPSAAPDGLPTGLRFALSSAPLNVLHCVWLC
jgi:hypothetical protein